jgi:uncharacterized membrane-anchored protein YitT (DUF2179 family)
MDFSKYFDTKMIVSVVVAIVVFVVINMVYQNYANKSTTTSTKKLTKAEYDALSTEDKAKWKASGEEYIPA